MRADTKKTVIFVVDDEQIIRVSMADELRDAGNTVFEFADPAIAIKQMETQKVDIVFTDIRMPEMDGLEFLTRIKEIDDRIVVIVMTSYASYPIAVEAVKKGAYDFLAKPFPLEGLPLIVNRISEIKILKEENDILTSQIRSHFNFSTFIGTDEERKYISSIVESVSDTSSTILITGETGTGKELLANIIHYNSNRRKKPFIKLSCAILSKEIIECELFGNVKGAFTGATSEKIGRFELAHGGTLFLDDIDDVPLEMQVKLLRFIETGEIEKVGSHKIQKLDVRIIASSRKNLRTLLGEHQFREDLFYRLNVFPIFLTPLREKSENISAIFNHFLQKFLNKSEVSVTRSALSILSRYKWPGNIRELKNIAERISLTTKSNIIDSEMIPVEIRNSKQLASDNSAGKSLNEIVRDVEIQAIKDALEKFNGHRSKAAEFLQLPNSTLQTKMTKYDIS